MSAIPILILLAVLAMLVAVLIIAFDVRHIRNELLPDIRATLIRSEQSHSAHFHVTSLHGHGWGHISTLGFFVYWEWRAGRWQCPNLPSGGEPQLPPNYPGAFEGDRAKTWVSLGN